MIARTSSFKYAHTNKGVDEIGKEQKAYHLSVRAKGGNEDVWVDTGTYLDLRYDRMAEGAPGGSRRVSVTYGDYRTVGGLEMPFLIETGSGEKVGHGAPRPSPMRKSGVPDLRSL